MGVFKRKHLVVLWYKAENAPGKGKHPHFKFLSKTLRSDQKKKKSGGKLTW